MNKICLANGGKHHWKYDDYEVKRDGKMRHCEGCGITQIQVGGKGGKYQLVGLTLPDLTWDEVKAMTDD